MKKMKSRNTIQRLLTVEDLADEWFSERSEINFFIKKGMPSIRIGRRIMFDLKECQKWYRSNAW